MYLYFGTNFCNVVLLLQISLRTEVHFKWLLTETKYPSKVLVHLSRKIEIISSRIAKLKRRKFCKALKAKLGCVKLLMFRLWIWLYWKLKWRTDSLKYQWLWKVGFFWQNSLDLRQWKYVLFPSHILHPMVGCQIWYNIILRSFR